MKLTDYHALRTGLQRNASPAGPAAVSELRERLGAALAASGLFHTVEADHTDDEDRLVIALAEFAPDVDAAHVAWQLERLWHDVLACPFWSAESIIVEDGHVELQGATRSSQQGQYLTLHVVAQEAVPSERPAADVVIPAQPGRPADAPVVQSVPTQGRPEETPQEAPARRRRLLGHS